MGRQPRGASGASAAGGTPAEPARVRGRLPRNPQRYDLATVGKAEPFARLGGRPTISAQADMAGSEQKFIDYNTIENKIMKNTSPHKYRLNFCKKSLFTIEKA